MTSCVASVKSASLPGLAALYTGTSPWGTVSMALQRAGGGDSRVVPCTQEAAPAPRYLDARDSISYAKTSAFSKTAPL